MQKLFYPDSVTIVRKKGDIHTREDIMTCPVLPDVGLSPEANRSNVIARLRSDPSVVLLLEDRGGACEETVQLRDGMSLCVRAVQSVVPLASVTLSCEGNEIYREDFTAEDCEENGISLLDKLVRQIIVILENVECGDYRFLPENVQHLVPVEPCEPINYFDACNLLRNSGYQTESIHTVGYARDPVLFVHENDVVLFGSHRFAGAEYFLEMKRLFNGVNANEVRSAVEELGKNSVINVIEWEDGSWSFRTTMDDDLDSDNFLDRLESDLFDIREFISRVEYRVGEEPWPITKEQRQLFIYEVVDTSLRLSRIKI